MVTIESRKNYFSSFCTLPHFVKISSHFIDLEMNSISDFILIFRDNLVENMKFLTVLRILLTKNDKVTLSILIVKSRT